MTATLVIESTGWGTVEIPVVVLTGSPTVAHTVAPGPSLTAAWSLRRVDRQARAELLAGRLPGRVSRVELAKPSCPPGLEERASLRRDGYLGSSDAAVVIPYFYDHRVLDADQPDVDGLQLLIPLS